jgi:hypothetical protein
MNSRLKGYILVQIVFIFLISPAYACKDSIDAIIDGEFEGVYRDMWRRLNMLKLACPENRRMAIIDGNGARSMVLGRYIVERGAVYLAESGFVIAKILMTSKKIKSRPDYFTIQNKLAYRFSNLHMSNFKSDMFKRLEAEFGWDKHKYFLTYGNVLFRDLLQKSRFILHKYDLYDSNGKELPDEKIIYVYLVNALIYSAEVFSLLDKWGYRDFEDEIFNEEVFIDSFLPQVEVFLDIANLDVLGDLF